MADFRETLFGSMAVRAGLVTEEHVKECLEFQAAERRAGRPVGKLGEILVARKHLKPEQIQAILDGQASMVGGKFGEIAVRLRLCSQPAVDAALKAQGAGKSEARIGELLVKAGELRAHHVAAILECQGLGLETCPGCGQEINLPQGAAGVRCPGCSTALSADAVGPEHPAASAPAPLPEAPAASPDDSQQVAAAASAKPAAQAASLGGYQVLAKLGTNASGGLYLARKGADAPLVTLKVFSAERSRGKGFVEGFKAAVKDGAKLRHPGINRVVDAGTDRGRVYCAAEYVEGKSLRSMLEGGKPMPVVDALRIARRMAEVLKYAHGQGVIHGEIKPSNVVLSAGSAVKITNFGMITSPLQNLVALARSAGSAPIYVAPELAIKGAVPTARNDIYSLGATLYHMLTGRAPYEGQSPLQVLLKISQEEAPKPGTLRKGLSVAVDEAVMHMLSADPANRPEDMEQVISELEAAAAGDAAADRNAAELVAGAELASDSAEQTEKKKLTGLVVVLGILLVFVLAALAFVVIAPAKLKPWPPEVSKLPEPPPKSAKAEPGPNDPRPPLTPPKQ